MRWGIIGCGDVADRRVADAIRNDPDSQLIAACRRSPDKLQQFASKYDVPETYTDHQQMLSVAKLDAVYIATPVVHHRTQTEAAAAAGLHVLVEKPMAMNVAECNAMIDSCKTAGVTLGVAYYRRFYPVVARINELLQSGELGRVFSVRATTATPPFPPNFEGAWRSEHAMSGGGSLMDIGSHRLDLFRYWFGQPKMVKALCNQQAAGEQDCEDSGTILCEFENGIHGIVNCIFGSANDPDELAILGSKGHIVSAPLNSGQLIWQRGTETIKESHPPNENFNTPLIADFIRAIRENREPTISGEDGRDVNQIIELAYTDSPLT